ncbi:hypothetical protein RCO48_18155 [Peribacillus frigoritolerans]|nr:hypothetical protein [Peribacillus frigoritolerans]
MQHTGNKRVHGLFLLIMCGGSEGIDAHFLPSQEVKEKLMSKRQIPKQTMMVTGIPVHEEITKKCPCPKKQRTAKKF